MILLLYLVWAKQRYLFNMKKLLPVLFIMLAVTIISGTVTGQELKTRSEKTTTDYSDPTTWLLGYFTANDLSFPPHDFWYNQGFDSYEANESTMKELKDLMNSEITITMVIGTWCPDCRREVPHFMRIISDLGYNIENITFIGVDSYKEAPLDIYATLSIERVPTFIFYRNKVELGRIIEYPVASLEIDMVNILK